MSAFLEHLLQRAAKLGKTIALAEGNDPRVAKAAEILTRDNICKVVLIGDEKKIREGSPDFKFDGVKFWNPAEGKHVEKYAEKLYELRKEKGMTEEVALRTIKGNAMFYACTALKCGDVDGVVGGAVLFRRRFPRGVSGHQGRSRNQERFQLLRYDSPGRIRVFPRSRLYFRRLRGHSLSHRKPTCRHRASGLFQRETDCRSGAQNRNAFFLHQGQRTARIRR